MTRVGRESHRLLRRRAYALWDKGEDTCDEILDWWLKPYTHDDKRVAFVREVVAATRAGGYDCPCGDTADGDAESAAECLDTLLNASVLHQLVAALVWRRWQRRR